MIEELLKLICEGRELAEMEKNNKMHGRSLGNISSGEVVGDAKGYQTDKIIHTPKHTHSHGHIHNTRSVNFHTVQNEK